MATVDNLLAGIHSRLGEILDRLEELEPYLRSGVPPEPPPAVPEPPRVRRLGLSSERKEVPAAVVSEPQDEDRIVECRICHQQLPQSAAPLHEENCERASRAYFDERSFRA